MSAVFYIVKHTWPTVTDDIRVTFYKLSDIDTPIASVQHNAPHIEQEFAFPGLPREPLYCRIFQAEINGSTIISELGHETVMAANDELLYKSPVDIQIGVTEIEGDEPNVWPAAALSVTVPGWIGYELIFGRNGVQYPMRKGVDYTWDAMTGLLTLQGEGDSFNDGEWFHAEFETIVRESSGGVGGGGGGSSAAGFSDILLVTANTTLTNDDLTKKILIAPSGTYLEITLPDVDTATANVFTFFEMYGGGPKCAKIKAATGQDIIWFNNHDLFICPGETLEIYKRVLTPGNNEWRVQNLCGNFMSVGDFVFNDNAEGNVALLDGSNKNYQQYARLYDWVSRNPGAIPYTSWNSSNDFMRVKFSLKESAGTNFRVADLITKPSYLRPGTSTDFVANKLLRHQHIDNSNVASDRSTSAFGYYDTPINPIGKYTGAGSYYPNMTSRAYKKNDSTGLWESVDGDESNPNSRISKVYVKI